MAFSAKVGSFNIDTAKTATQTQAITGVGFQPKVVLFFWGGSTGTDDTAAGGDLNFGFGAASSSSSRWGVYGASVDGAATSATVRGQYTTDIMRAYVSGTTTIEGILDFASLDADGFTVTIDDQFANAYRISYLALGGVDLTNVYLGAQQMPTSTGNYAVTGVGFQPSALLFAMPGLSTSNQRSTVQYFTLGMATGASNQGVVMGGSDNAAATTNTYGYGYNGEVLSRDANYREALVSLDTDGFTLNHLEGATAFWFYYVALKGGQYSVSDITTRTDGADIAETVGFQPAALLFASANRELSTQDTISNHSRISIGAATSTSNRACMAISDEDNLADSETAYANYDSAVYANLVDDAAVGLMDLKSIDASGFTCVMDDTDPAGCWVTYLAIGAAVGANRLLYAEQMRAMAE